jgi:phage regulator Rha-like protein
MFHLDHSTIAYINSRYIPKAEVVTDSYKMSKALDVTHKSILQLVKKYESELKELGTVLAFEMLPQTDTLGREYTMTIYSFTEDQAFFVLSFLRPTKKVIEARKAYVKAFRNTRNDLELLKITRQKEKENWKLLTDQIAESNSESANLRFKFKHYADLIYKSVLGLNCKQFAEKHNCDIGSIKDYLTVEELHKINNAEIKVRTLLGVCFNYKRIKKEMLLP